MWWLQDTAYEEAGCCGDNTSYPQGYGIPQCTPHQVFYSSFLLESMDVSFCYQPYKAVLPLKF